MQSSVYTMVTGCELRPVLNLSLSKDCTQQEPQESSAVEHSLLIGQQGHTSSIVPGSSTAQPLEVPPQLPPLLQLPGAVLSHIAIKLSSRDRLLLAKLVLGQPTAAAKRHHQQQQAAVSASSSSSSGLQRCLQRWLQPFAPASPASHHSKAAAETAGPVAAEAASAPPGSSTSDQRAAKAAAAAAVLDSIASCSLQLPANGSLSCLQQLQQLRALSVAFTGHGGGSSLSRSHDVTPLLQATSLVQLTLDGREVSSRESTAPFVSPSFPQSIIGALYQLTALQRLGLHHVVLPTGCNIADVCGRLQQLQLLELECITPPITPEAAAQLATAGLLHLRGLTFINCIAAGTGSGPFIAALHLLLPQVQQLSLEGLGSLDDTSMEVLAQASNPARLRALNLNHVALPRAFVSSLAALSGLEELQVGWAGLDAEDVAVLAAAGLSLLTQLVLAGNEAIGEEGVACISSFSSLRELDIGSIELEQGGACMVRLVSSLQQLTALRAANIEHLAPAALVTLSQLSQLQQLELGCVSCSRQDLEDAVYAALVLEPAGPVAWPESGPEDQAGQAVEAVGVVEAYSRCWTALRQLQQLTKLVLHSDCLGAGCLQQLGRLPLLQHLHIGALGELGVEDMAALAQLTGLTTLWLDGRNSVGSSDTLAACWQLGSAGMLTALTGLRRLRVDDIVIGLTDVMFVTLLTQLEVLELNGCVGMLALGRHGHAAFEQQIWATLPNLRALHV